MKRFGLAILYIAILGFADVEAAGTIAPRNCRREQVQQLLLAIGQELPDPQDQRALQRLVRVFSAHGAVTVDHSGDHVDLWVLLEFDQEGTLQAVAIDAKRLLAAPPLIQRAVILHELEHLKSGEETNRLVKVLVEQRLRHGREDGHVRQPEAARTLQEVIRVLVLEEARAYRRDIEYIGAIMRAGGGMEAYVKTLDPAQQPIVIAFYQQNVRPFLNDDGTINDRRLRREFIFLRTFPHRYPSYYNAALLLEALQGNVTFRRNIDGTWHIILPAHSPTFLAWLSK